MRRTFLQACLAVELLICQNAFSLESRTGSQSPLIKEIKNGIELTTGKMNLRVQFYDANIVRVLKWCKGGSPEKLSLSVTMKRIPVIAIDVEKNDSMLVLSSPNLKIRISMMNGDIKYYDRAGRSVLDEKGDPTFFPLAYGSDSGFSIQQDFKLTGDEGVYGLGQNQDGYFNYRGRREVLVQSNTNAVVPFLVSTKNYGILWDNYSKTIFEDDSICTSLWSDIGNNIDYYFIVGNNMDEVVAGYRELTGRAPLYGKWAYGYWQSKEHYKTQAEVLSVAEKYRQLKCPSTTSCRIGIIGMEMRIGEGCFSTGLCTLIRERCATSFTSCISISCFPSGQRLDRRRQSTPI